MFEMGTGVSSSLWSPVRKTDKCTGKLREGLPGSADGGGVRSGGRVGRRRIRLRLVRMRYRICWKCDSAVTGEVGLAPRGRPWHHPRAPGDACSGGSGGGTLGGAGRHTGSARQGRNGGQASRLISTGSLRPSPALHVLPIDPVFFRVP